MPLYEYRCDQCGEQFELIQKFADEPLTRHDKCGGVVHRLLSAPALQFKGSGWYVTDYAKGGSKAASDNGTPAKSEAREKTKSGSESSSSTPAASSSDSGTKSSSDTKSGSDTKSKS
ncbi:MAG TPA: FmdB family zinc ribbon protein [Bryobacteraceae bacterium]|jgi:putative FmdB family regulatory protein|nr:FmdB family zinc ribbon protein [Bryobacteraceae bacterium]